MITSYSRIVFVDRIAFRLRRWVVLVSTLFLLLSEGTFGFFTTAHTCRCHHQRLPCLLSAKTSRKKKARSGGSAAGIKGFGAAAPKSKDNVDTDKSREARAFYEFLDKNGAGDNLKRTALGFFPLPSGGKLRGVVALKDIKKGDDIINIPYELAVNLGREGEDPTLPALELLRNYCEKLSSEQVSSQKAYFEMLP